MQEDRLPKSGKTIDKWGLSGTGGCRDSTAAGLQSARSSRSRPTLAAVNVRSGFFSLHQREICSTSEDRDTSKGMSLANGAGG